MRTLWFIRGPATDEQVAHAAENGLSIRDSAAYVPGDFIEPANAVMGDAPAAYLEAYGEVPPVDISDDGGSGDKPRRGRPKKIEG